MFQIHSTFPRVLSKLKSIKGVSLSVANKIYIQEGDYDLDEKFKEDAVRVFDSALEKINFSNGPAAADLINKWIESKTNGKIRKLMTGDSFDTNASLVLLSAIHFKGTWKKPFNPFDTMEYLFCVEDELGTDVDMMYKEDNYLYGESAELAAQVAQEQTFFQLLQIPYVGDEASMLIVLPNEVEGLDAILKKLADGYDLLGELDKMHETKVQAYIPIFEIETEIDLNSLLPKLGINAIFDSQNSGITKVVNKPEPLYVSKAIQKVYIEVNEGGAEASADTVMGITPHSATIDAPNVPRFVANHPFLVAIISDRTIYFMATERAK